MTNDPVNLKDPLGLERFLVTSWGMCFGFGDEWLCTWFTTFQDLGPSPGDAPTLPVKPVLTQKIYDDCAKNAFGAQRGTIPGTQSFGGRSIPSPEAAALVFDAATFEGVDPALVGATMSIESNSNLHIPTNLNNNGTLDIGPMQLNSASVGQAYPNYPGATGTNLGPNDRFNGDPFANIASGANYLRKLGNHPERYVGSNPDHKNQLKALLPSMSKFFDCIRKGLRLAK